MSKDPSVKWHHHPANASELDLLADIIRYQTERINRPHIEPRAVEWPTWASAREIPPVERFATVVDFAWAMAKVVEDAVFFGRVGEPENYRVHWRDHSTGREYVAANGHLMTRARAVAAAAMFADGWVVDVTTGQTIVATAAKKCAACSMPIEDPELGCSRVEDYEQSRDICGECGATVGELGDCQCDDEPLEITPSSLKATLDRMHAALTQDEGVAG